MAARNRKRKIEDAEKAAVEPLDDDNEVATTWVLERLAAPAPVPRRRWTEYQYCTTTLVSPERLDKILDARVSKPYFDMVHKQLSSKLEVDPAKVAGLAPGFVRATVQLRWRWFSAAHKEKDKEKKTWLSLESCEIPVALYNLCVNPGEVRAFTLAATEPPRPFFGIDRDWVVLRLDKFPPFFSFDLLSRRVADLSSVRTDDWPTSTHGPFSVSLDVQKIVLMDWFAARPGACALLPHLLSLCFDYAQSLP